MQKLSIILCMDLDSKRRCKGIWTESGNTSSNHYVYNNTVSNNYQGFRASWAGHTLNNNISSGNTTDFVTTNGVITGSNNISSDATSPDAYQL